MARIPFPNVPNASGVPQVLRKLPAGPGAVIGSIAGIAQLVKAFTSKPAWGVYKHVDEVSDQPDADGLLVITITAKRSPVVTPDSFREFSYQQGWTVTTAPTQKGAFADYNRVATPYETRLRMTKGGSEKDRTAFLKQIEALDGVTLYDIITPEKTYVSCNIVDYEYVRTEQKGAYWLSAVDVYFREIRNVTAQYIRTDIVQPKSPSASNPQNNGVQQGTSTSKPVPKSVKK